MASSERRNICVVHLIRLVLLWHIFNAGRDNFYFNILMHSSSVNFCPLSVIESFFFPFWNESYCIGHIALVVFTSRRNLQRKNSLHVSHGSDVCSRAWGLEVLHKAWQLPLILLAGTNRAFGSRWNNYKWNQTKTIYPIRFSTTFSVVLCCVVLWDYLFPGLLVPRQFKGHTLFQSTLITCNKLYFFVKLDKNKK